MHRTPLIGATLALALSMPGTPAVRAHNSTADVVFEWNQILQDTVPSPQNVLTPRFFALTHIAMFDAINTFEREFEPYRVRLRHGSADRRKPRRRRRPTTCSWPSTPRARPRTTPRSPAGSGPIRRASSASAPTVGANVAREILAWRQTDGWVVSPFPPYSEPPLPGRWQQTPPANANAAFTHLQYAAPLALLTLHAVPAAAASVADQRALRHRSERGETDREIGQHRPALPSRPPSHGCGTARRRRARGPRPTISRSGTTSRATPRARAGCRSSRPRECSRSSTCRCTTVCRPPR